MLGLVVLVAVGWRIPPRRVRWLILLAVVSGIALTATIWRQTQRLNAISKIDVALYIDMASELVQRRENPYAWDFSNVAEVYCVAQAASTSRLNGSMIERYDSPALSVLTVLSFEIVSLPGEWLAPVEVRQMTRMCRARIMVARSTMYASAAVTIRCHVPTIMASNIRYLEISLMTSAPMSSIFWGGGGRYTQAVHR